jgi:hypothetical protein
MTSYNPHQRYAVDSRDYRHIRNNAPGKNNRPTYQPDEDIVTENFNNPISAAPIQSDQQTNFQQSSQPTVYHPRRHSTRKYHGSNPNNFLDKALFYYYGQNPNYNPYTKAANSRYSVNYPYRYYDPCPANYYRTWNKLS